MLEQKTDKENFIALLTNALDGAFGVFEFTLENTTSKPMKVWVEPTGDGTIIQPNEVLDFVMLGELGIRCPKIQFLDNQYPRQF